MKNPFPIADSDRHAETDLLKALHNLTTLRDIEVADDRALAHKKFDGTIRLKSGTSTLRWQTLYHLRKIDGSWKIVGFTGYLSFPMGMASAPIHDELHPKQLPAGASQHKTAGTVRFGCVTVRPGDIVFGDLDGVCIIPREIER